VIDLRAPSPGVILLRNSSWFPVPLALQSLPSQAGHGSSRGIFVLSEKEYAESAAPLLVLSGPVPLMSQSFEAPLHARLSQISDCLILKITRPVLRQNAFAMGIISGVRHILPHSLESVCRRQKPGRAEPSMRDITLAREEHVVCHAVDMNPYETLLTWQPSADGEVRYKRLAQFALNRPRPRPSSPKVVVGDRESIWALQLYRFPW